MRVTAVRRAFVVLGAFVVFSVAASAVLAAIPGAGGVVNGCYNNKSGALRVIDSAASCVRGETAISWNQQGIQGIQGIQGLKGDKGDPGDPAAASTEMVTWHGTAATTLDPTRWRAVSTTHLEAGSIIDSLAATMSGSGASCDILNGWVGVHYDGGTASSDHGFYLATASSLRMTSGQLVDGPMSDLRPITLTEGGNLWFEGWCQDTNGYAVNLSSLSVSFTFDWTHPGSQRVIN